MIKNIQFMEQLNQYYTTWQEWNCMYEEWAKANGLSANSLLVLSAIYDSKEECTQKKISQRWLVPKQTVNMILKDFEKQGLSNCLLCGQTKGARQSALHQREKNMQKPFCLNFEKWK